MARKTLRQTLRDDSGAALLVVLLLVATLSVISVSILQTITRSVQVSTVSSSRNQIGWFIRGAEALAAVKIGQLIELTDGEITRFSPGLNQQVIFPVEGGTLLARVEDHSNCFNLNSLAVAEEEDTELLVSPQDFYTDLLEALGYPVNQANQLMSTAADWVDTDSTQRAYGAESGYYASLSRPRGAANGPMVTPEELLDVRGYTPEIYSVIAPYVCAFPNEEIGIFNVNTMDQNHAPLMYAVFSGQIASESMVGIMQAQGLTEHPDVASFLSNPNLAAIHEDFRHETILSVASNHFRLVGEVVYQETVASYEAIFVTDTTGNVRFIRRRLGVDE